MKNGLARLTALLLLTSSQLSIGSETYAPAKVVYDVSSSSPEELHAILDRVGLLQEIYGSDPFESSVIVVIHEGAIPLFSDTETREPNVVQRSRDFSIGEVIQFRLCRASARQQGFEGRDFPDFIQLVPMADAEIVYLQNKGYAYLH